MKYTEEQIKEIKDKINSITTMIPESMTQWVWNTYKDISGSNEPQPCSCGSAGRLWRKAVEEIKAFVNENDR
tara:strand:+ start:240 stop:455 length:216 start_codon:yes stop_codon:yes gene_type:complete